MFAILGCILPTIPLNSQDMFTKYHKIIDQRKKTLCHKEIKHSRKYRTWRRGISKIYAIKKKRVVEKRMKSGMI